MTGNQGESRLDRIEGKLDQIQEVLVSMARIEERQAQTEEFNQNLIRLYEKLDDRVDSLERVVTKNSIFTGAFSQVGWILAAAIIGAVIKGYF